MMLSRVAENLYWLARYVERAENTARLIKVNTPLVMDTPKGITPGWEPLVSITGLDQVFTDSFKDANERNVVRFLIDDKSNHNSIVACLKQARENCRTVREVLPRQSWELLNELNIYAQDHARSGISKKGRDEYLDDIISGSQQFAGLLGSELYRDEGYHFVRIGRNLERADMTTRIIDVRSTDLFEEDLLESRTLDTLQWISVLKSLSGHQSYRRQVQIRVSRGAVLKFLFTDDRFPRSVYYNLESVEESVTTFINSRKTLSAIRRSLNRLNRIKTNSISQSALHRAIDELQVGIMEIHKSLVNSYFSYTDLSKTGI